MNDPVPSPAPIRETPAVGARRTWIAGTLVYSAGGLASVFGWLLLGDFAWQLRERSATPVMQLMLRQRGASDFVAGLFTLSFPALVSVILVTALSYRSDRHRGRWGRRIPYLLVTSPLAAVALCALAYSEEIGLRVHQWFGGSGSLDQTILIVMGVSWTVFEFGAVTTNTLYGALVNDVVPRELVGRFFGLFRIVSLATGMLFGRFIIGEAEKYFQVILVGVGLLYGVGMILMCLRVKEGHYPPPNDATPNRPRGVVSAIEMYARECFSKPYYLLVFSTMMFAQLAFTPVNAYSVYAAKRFDLPLSTYGTLLAISYACSAVLAYPLGWMADRFHAVRLGLVTQAIYAIVMGAGFFWISGPRSFGGMFLTHCVLSGCYFTGAAALGQMLFPKLKYGQFAAANAMFLSLSSIVVGIVLGSALDELGHDYRFVFAFGALFALLAVLTNLMVERRFNALGGTARYVAPE